MLSLGTCSLSETGEKTVVGAVPIPVDIFVVKSRPSNSKCSSDSSTSTARQKTKNTCNNQFLSFSLFLSPLFLFLCSQPPMFSHFPVSSCRIHLPLTHASSFLLRFLTLPILAFLFTLSESSHPFMQSFHFFHSPPFLLSGARSTESNRGKKKQKHERTRMCVCESPDHNRKRGMEKIG